jgi:hypothetical protein
MDAVYLTGSCSLPLANPGPPRSARQSRAALALLIGGYR